ncbi:hypothetical protein PCL_07089 [Purpureocillium lilacinum]|uniref:Uncharacterized protein n=1 Tax=Purpureocillium lilacinum TaxID=33203 RepID=A0A2U3DTA8_PURLI|nr:hypothetical protein PCL_07089 [Purpureocillium lilacinum]
MNRRPRRQHRDKRLFRVFQANVGKNGPSHDCALALADAERYEVILLQEPWTQVRDSRCLTKTHPAYDTYSPVSTWEDIDTRPRVMTYIRRGARLLADQQRPALSRDILWLVVNGVTLVNVYREPNLDTALEVLFAWPIPSQCIIAGDFNARHHTWQIGPSRGYGGIIAEWAAENDLDLLNPINTPTNSARRRSRPHGWRGCCAEGRHALLWLGRRGSWDPDRKDHDYEAGWTRPMPSPPPPPAAQGAGWADYGLHAKKVKMQGRMLRKAARKRFEEGQTTLEEAEPYRILTATMPVDALTADWSMGSNRPIQEKHVNALYTIFQRGDMKRARYPLAVLSTRSEVQCMLHEMGYDGDTPDADDVPSFDKWLLVNGRPVELLDGQHRVAPLKRIVSGSGSGKQELYWPCNIYDRGMPHATAAEADVVLWLSSILDLKNEPLPILTESDRVNYDGGHRKRRKLGTHRHRLPSPPSSEPTSSMADLPPSSMKRSRDPDDPANLARWDMSSAQSDETQDQSTPRPGRLQQTQTTEWIPFSAGSSHGSQSWTSSPSSRSAPVLKRPKSTSSRTSPSRQLRNAEINQTGFRMGSFRLDTYPDSLNALRCELRDIGLGDGILPASLEHELRRADSEIPRFAFDRDEATRALTEAIATDLPPIDWVQALMKRADECELNRECESSWNGEIHAAILEQAFRTNRFVSNGPVDFRYAQAAQIVHAYKPREAPSKMVDFCVFCRPAKGSAEEQAIDDICQTRPAQSINHTDLGDFCKRPIALSIETKRPHVERDNATLQIGTWQSAQWRSLRHNRSRPLESIEFLPGIIVQGHDWQFVASVLDENDKSVLLKGPAAVETVDFGGLLADVYFGCFGHFMIWIPKMIPTGFINYSDRSAPLVLTAPLTQQYSIIATMKIDKCPRLAEDPTLGISDMIHGNVAEMEPQMLRALQLSGDVSFPLPRLVTIWRNERWRQMTPRWVETTVGRATFQISTWDWMICHRIDDFWFMAFRQVLGMLAQLPGDAAKLVSSEDWKTMSASLGVERTQEQVQELFYPGQSGKPLSAASKRNPKLLQSFDDRGYWDIYDRVLRTPALRFPDVHCITGMSRGNGRVLFQVLDHVVSWLKSKRTGVNRGSNTEPQLRLDLEQKLDYYTPTRLRQAENRVKMGVFEPNCLAVSVKANIGSSRLGVITPLILHQHSLSGRFNLIAIFFATYISVCRKQQPYRTYEKVDATPELVRRPSNFFQ